MLRMSRTLLVTATAALAVLAPAASARPMPVPPQDCGFMTVKGKRYNVKADRLRCCKAEGYVEAYFKRGVKPKRFTCQTPPRAETTIRLRCFKGKVEFFAIQR